MFLFYKPNPPESPIFYNRRLCTAGQHRSTMMAQISPGGDITERYYVAFASFTVLVWDHILTFGDEIEYIWKGKKGPIIYLFILNRYFTPLGFVLNLFAYLSPVWTAEMCPLCPL
ncbi:hypothetical protein BD779DRAFT_1151212 [Infundibulicybe gibba]|nr:hypothetical protein BD779DRAFT_1151212 [Infundibulicybe gibba]